MSFQGPHKRRRIRIWELVLRVLQLVFALAILALTIYAQWIWPWGPWNPAPPFQKGQFADLYDPEIFWYGGFLWVWVASGCTALLFTTTVLLGPKVPSLAIKWAFETLFELGALIMWSMAVSFLIPSYRGVMANPYWGLEGIDGANPGDGGLGDNYNYDNVDLLVAKIKSLERETFRFTHGALILAVATL
jgi:hypothetical protein